MTTGNQAISPSIDTPTSEQAVRYRQRRQFTWLFVFLPTILAFVGVLVIVGWLAWGVLGTSEAVSAEFVSGVVDVLLIVVLLPWLLVCGLTAIGGVGLLVFLFQRQRGEDVPKYGRIQTLFWRIDRQLTQAQNRIRHTAPRLAQPVMNLNTRLTYWSRAIINLLKLVLRR
ncbi:MAG: hypothetical protein D6706_09015 [Chloroflexi bacterium]|nr:MAG: hypothetical protein D6706_09015 [Chloroflexota bacterium]